MLALANIQPIDSPFFFLAFLMVATFFGAIVYSLLGKNPTAMSVILKHNNNDKKRWIEQSARGLLETQLTIPSTNAKSFLCLFHAQCLLFGKTAYAKADEIGSYHDEHPGELNVTLRLCGDFLESVTECRQRTSDLRNMNRDDEVDLAHVMAIAAAHDAIAAYR